MQEKEVTTAFRLPEGQLKRIDELSRELGLDRSQFLRFAANELLNEAPEMRQEKRAKKATDIGRKVYNLHKAGKHSRARELVNQSVKMGVYPVHFIWPEAEKEKGKSRRKVLKERYGKKFKEKKE